MYNLIDQALSHLFKECRENASTLVVATKRLARELRQQYNNAQVQDGNLVWQSPDILTFDAWVYRLWQQPWDQSSESKSNVEEANRRALVLSALQSRALWQKIISEDISSRHGDIEPLWHIPATVSSAINAWKLCSEWQIDIQQITTSFAQDHRCFAKWAILYQQTCEENNWIDPQQLIDHVSIKIKNKCISNIPGVTLFGFDLLTAQQGELISTLTDNAFEIKLNRAGVHKKDGTLKHQYYLDEYQQWLAAAQWALQQRLSDPSRKIAIVVPDINQSRDIIEYAMDQILNPKEMIEGSKDSARPFHISLGKPLAGYPVTKALLSLLALTSKRKISNLAIAEFILSPFIKGANSERFARSKLEYWCRSNLPFEISLHGFFSVLNNNKYAPVAPDLLNTIENALNLQNEFTSKKPFLNWVESILHWLESFGWPGEQSINSEEFQIVGAVKKEIIALATLDTVTPPMTMSHVISVLTQRLQEQPFESESTEANIEILGLLETAGMQFDAIWLGNLTDRNWPTNVNQNPFIPYKLQAHIPRANYQLNIDLAEQQLSRLCKQGNEIVFSRYVYEGDVETMPSQMFSQNPAELGKVQSLLQSSQRTSVSVLFHDDNGTPHSSSHTRGGTGLIKAQSACPFQAYARYRLDAHNEEFNQPGLDAAQRGSLVHSVLESTWLEIKTSENLQAMTKTDLSTMLEQHISIHSKRYFTNSGSSSNFFAVQSQWLLRLFLQWFELEKCRDQPFEISELEKKIQLNLSSLKLELKIDRIDKLQDNSLLLIDYKTGRADNINAWIKPRPSAPQLPLYALAQLSDVSTDPTLEVSGLSFGQVRSGECAHIGISKNPSLQQTRQSGLHFQSIENDTLSENFDSWEALLDFWQIELGKLAKEFESGYAVVAPSDSACRYCDLPGFCRIAELDEIIEQTDD